MVHTEALRLAGIGRDTPDPADGRIERDAAGNPTGTLHEGAALLVQRLIPTVSMDDAVAGLARGQEEMFRFGVTGWADAWVGKTGGMDDIFAVYLAALVATWPGANPAWGASMSKTEEIRRAPSFGCESRRTRPGSFVSTVNEPCNAFRSSDAAELGAGRAPYARHRASSWHPVARFVR